MRAHLKLKAGKTVQVPPVSWKHETAKVSWESPKRTKKKLALPMKRKHLWESSMQLLAGQCMSGHFAYHLTLLVKKWPEERNSSFLPFQRDPLKKRFEKAFRRPKSIKFDSFWLKSSKFEKQVENSSPQAKTWIFWLSFKIPHLVAPNIPVKLLTQCIIHWRYTKTQSLSSQSSWEEQKTWS